MAEKEFMKADITRPLKLDLTPWKNSLNDRDSYTLIQSNPMKNFLYSKFALAYGGPPSQVCARWIRSWPPMETSRTFSAHISGGEGNKFRNCDGFEQPKYYVD